MCFCAQNFLDNFQAAQQAIADASAAAAETAKQNMVEAYSNAKRMLLNVRIKAPIIVVPVDSRSLQAISIDLGHLCITNRCSNIPNSAVVSNENIFPFGFFIFFLYLCTQWTNFFRLYRLIVVRPFWMK